MSLEITITIGDIKLGVVTYGIPEKDANLLRAMANTVLHHIYPDTRLRV
jgi:hypothetical protein